MEESLWSSEVKYIWFCLGCGSSIHTGVECCDCSAWWETGTQIARQEGFHSKDGFVSTCVYGCLKYYDKKLHLQKIAIAFLSKETLLLLRIIVGIWRHEVNIIIVRRVGFGMESWVKPQWGSEAATTFFFPQSTHTHGGTLRIIFHFTMLNSINFWTQ